MRLSSWKRWGLILVALGPLSACSGNQMAMKIGGATLSVEIADQPETRGQGLSGRTSLAKNKGMLFIFETPGKYGFWMKEMNFPLDFIWINNQEVLGVTKNVQPGQTNILPPEPVVQVVEVNSGWVNQHQIKIGDKIQL